MAIQLKEKVKTILNDNSLFLMNKNVTNRSLESNMDSVVLILYLTNILLISDSNAVSIYHGFTVICYATPILGAILADSYLGKFKTISYIAIVYAFGSIIISIASIPDLHLPVLETSLFGLLLIGLGTGGIKSCVCAFGGDQFLSGQEKQRQQFYSLFFLSINAGSLTSNLVTPLLRTHVSCFGADTCYPLAFGISAVLMVIALILFLFGRPMYKIYSPQSNIFVNVMQITGRAICLCFSNGRKRSHWLDHADDKYDKKLIADVKSFYKVLWVYLLMSIFWALNDQSSSRWTLQANKMDGRLGFINFTVSPDQMFILNPLSFICFVPFTEIVLYPLFNKCGILKKPLQRICCGGVLLALSFFLAGLIEVQLEKTLSVPVNADNSEFTFVNSLPCALKLNFNQKVYQIAPLSNHILGAINSKTNYTGTATFSRENFTDCPLQKDISGKFSIYPESQKAFTLAFGSVDNLISYKQGEDSRDKAVNRKSNIRFIYNLRNSIDNTSVTLESMSGIRNYTIILSEIGETFGLTSYTELIKPDQFEVFIGSSPRAAGQVVIGQDVFQTVILYETENGRIIMCTVIIIETNSLSMFLQVPQYLLLALAEVLFAITGLEFSYSQAPLSMKAVMQAIFLLSEACGNLIVVIITEAEIFSKQSYHFFFFAGLMLIDVAIFAIRAYYYVYVEEENVESESEIVNTNQTENDYNLKKEEVKKSKTCRSHALKKSKD